MDLAWQRSAFYPLEVRPPFFAADTDVFLFFEQTLTQPKLFERVPLEKRFGLLFEASAGRTFPALSISQVEKFRGIFTHDPLLLSLHPNYRKNLFGTSWSFRPEDLHVPPTKAQGISMISSNLAKLPGHRLRLDLCRRIREAGLPVDIFGRNIPWGPFLEDRRDGVAPYRFSVVIENCRRENYFTEKLVDCFVTRTVPIYWGCPNISSYFEESGILEASSREDLLKIITRIAQDPLAEYDMRKDALEVNFSRALRIGNVRHAAASVVQNLTQELSQPFVKPQGLTATERMRNRQVQLGFLWQDHGLLGLVKALLGRA